MTRVVTASVDFILCLWLCHLFDTASSFVSAENLFEGFFPYPF